MGKGRTANDGRTENTLYRHRSSNTQTYWPLPQSSDLKGQVKTITFDNGLEFAAHEVMAKGLEADIYFAHPYSSWERGINENTNGLIRQYFPKGTDFNHVTDEQIKHVMDRLNNRPRKTRSGQSPNKLFKGLQVDLLAA